MPLHVPGYGDIEVDIAYGGCYYVLADAAQLDLQLTRDRAREVVEAGTAIFRAASDAIAVRHPEVPEIDFISYAMLTGDDDPAAGRLRGATVLSGRVDRSPCGTGNSARLACMAARGQAGVGSRFVATSLIDSEFAVELAGTERGRRAARRCCRASRVAAGWSARGSPRSIRAIPTRRDTCFRTCGGPILPRRQRSPSRARHR